MSEKIESLFTEQERLKAENDLLKAQAERDRQSSLNKIGATKADTYYGLQGANLINQYLTAQQQKKRGAAELARLKGQRPELSPYVKDVRLQQRIAEADQARLTGLSPDAQRIADRQMLQGQLAMDQRARTASGGQAGMYGNLAQQGALARYGAAPEMALAQEEARLGKQQIYDALSERAMLEDQAALARQDAEQLARRGEWQDAMKAAQATEAAGRANLLDIYEQLPYYASNVAGTYTNLNEQRPWRVNERGEAVADDVVTSDVVDPRYEFDRKTDRERRRENARAVREGARVSKDLLKDRKKQAKIQEDRERRRGREEEWLKKFNEKHLYSPEEVKQARIQEDRARRREREEKWLKKFNERNALPEEGRKARRQEEWERDQLEKQREQEKIFNEMYGLSYSPYMDTPYGTAYQDAEDLIAEHYNNRTV